MFKELVSAILVSLLLHVQERSSFLIEGPCPAGPPCQCAGDTLYCSDRHFSSVPPFHSTMWNHPYMRLKLDGNNLWTIPANAFHNLAPMNGTFIQIDLYGNELRHIDDNAFTGIENEIGVLDLENNNLRVLPRAIGKLRNLRNLFLRDNSLSTLDPFVMNAISGSLRKFKLSLRHFTSWPKEIKLLSSLEVFYVRVYDIRMDDDAFEGSVNTLQQLKIVNSYYDYISPAVCRLRALTNIIFDYDDGYSTKNTTFPSDFIPCSIPTLEYISLEDTFSFTSKMFAQFPALKTLQLITPENNKFDNRYIPLNSSLTRLVLKGCQYNNVPGAVNIFSNLKELDLRENHIKTISDYDLTGLTQLEKLILQDNPLTDISENAFAKNPNLHVLNVEATDLDSLPVAVTKLASLQSLNMDSTLIHCDCNSMSNLTTWNVQGITIVGDCYRTQTEIKSYLSNSLPKCP